MRDISPDVQGLLDKENVSESERWSEETTSHFNHARERPKRKFLSSSVVVLSITNIASIGIILYLLATTRRSQPQPPRVNQPPEGVTPSLAHLVRDPEPRLFNVSFYPDGKTPWRGHNSTETDKAWREYVPVGRLIMLPKEEAAAASIDPTRHAYIDRPDLGMVGYPVIVEAVHQMHCLDLLRRNLYYNKAFTDANCEPHECVSKGFERYGVWHLDHCVEMLRNRIACTSDLGVVPHLWYKHAGRLTIENARMHTCANYDALKDFMHATGVEPPEIGSPGRLRPPAGAYVMSDYDQ
ncbi:hypothetical protein F5Y17DRAFT_439825 [Xylariaceae sp. FL0594]|nr:hypothetical protein F5Y17DRAFT_439825 [Xylariaceae sp. FL0594]